MRQNRLRWPLVRFVRSLCSDAEHREHALRILFVENHRVFAETVVSEFLRDHDVTIATNVADALKLFDDGIFDIVLVDYDLDDGKGDEFVRQVRRCGASVPVVATSAHEDGNAALLVAGANVACPKSQFRQIDAFLGSFTA